MKICECKKFSHNCKKHNSKNFCECGKYKWSCKIHHPFHSPLELTIRRMIGNSKRTDERLGIYDKDNFIDKKFIYKLVDKCRMKCYYCKCKMTAGNSCKTHMSIERLNNNIGHIKSNSVLACLNCNIRKVGNKPNLTVDTNIDADIKVFDNINVKSILLDGKYHITNNSNAVVKIEILK